MEMSELSLSFEPPLARLRLARPERRNAMTLAMWRALPELCAEVGRREDGRVVVVEGAGGHFCAGADISEFDAVFRDAAAAREYLGAIEVGLEALIALDPSDDRRARGLLDRRRPCARALLRPALLRGERAPRDPARRARPALRARRT